MSSSASHKVDVLIIGGGIVGFAVGYYLAKRNYCNVEIVERETEITAHASGHNAGGLAGAHFNQPRELWPLFKRSQQIYSELSETAGFEFEYTKGGTISPGTSEDETRFEEIAHKFRDGSEGIRVNFLDKAELEKREPNLSVDRFSCALNYPLDAQGNSKKLGECFARFCTRKGIRISTGTTVTGFQITGGKVLEVKTGRGQTILPDSIVVAAGPWSAEISARLGMELPINPVKGHLISFEAGSERLVNSFISGPLYYVMQNRSNVIVGGGEDESGFDVRPDPSRVSDAWAEGVSMVPKLAAFAGRTVATACLRPHARGGVPFLGRSKLLDNVLFATGHFRNGFGLAPVTGELISQLLLDGKSEIDLSPFSPDRFSRGHG